MTMGQSENQNGSPTPTNAIVSLNLQKKDVAGFIATLFDRPRTLERSWSRPFDINLNWIVDLHNVITQRIQNQNHVELAGFIFRLQFEDSTMVTIPSLNEFLSFRDVSSRQPVYISLSWTFLVQFPGSDLPNAQSILFTAQSGYPSASENETSIIDRVALKLSAPVQYSDMYARVDYTEVTWGQDVMNWIAQKVELSFKPRGAARDLVSTAARLWLPLLLLLAVIVLPLVHRSEQIKQTLLQRGQVINSSAENVVSQKLDYLIILLERGTSGFTVAFWIAAIAIAAFPISIFMLAKSQPVSHLVFNETSEIRRAGEVQRRQNLFWGGWVALSIGVIGSLLASVLEPLIRL